MRTNKQNHNIIVILLINTLYYQFLLQYMTYILCKKIDNMFY